MAGKTPVVFAAMEVVREHGSAFDDLLRETRPLAEDFRRSGKRLYLVGGIVRDGLRGRERIDLDIDMTTDARPDEIEAILAARRPTALWLQGKRFGTIGARFVGSDGVERAFEVTTHRSDEYALASRKPEVAFSDDIVVDLSRRDFTVNAMAIDAMSPLGGAVLIDPFSGLDDLRRGRLRTPLDPEVSFTDDPLRMLRAARFVAGHDLVGDPALLDAMRRLRTRLSIVSAERIRDEFSKLIGLPRPAAGLGVLADTSLLDVFAPTFAALAGDPARLARVGTVLSACPDDTVVRLAVLFILVGEPNLDSDGAAYRWAVGLRYPLDACERLRSLLHLRTLFPELNDVPGVRRFIRGAGDLCEQVLTVVQLTDGHDDRSGAMRLVIAGLAASEGVDMASSLDGEAVMGELGIGPGRDVGEALAMLLALRLDEGPLGPDVERQRLRTWWAARTSGSASAQPPDR